MSLEKFIKMKRVVQSKIGLPHKWGHNDCYTFIVEIHEAVYGEINPQFKHKYSNRKECLQWFKNNFSDKDITKNTPLSDYYENIQCNQSELTNGDIFFYIKGKIPHFIVYFEKMWLGVTIDGLKVIEDMPSNLKVWRNKCQQ